MNLNTDLAAIKNPMAVYWLISINVKIRKRSKNPIHIPAFASPSVLTPGSLRHLSVAIPISIPKGHVTIRYPAITAKN
jgi:hypothetical protein